MSGNKPENMAAYKFLQDPRNAVPVGSSLDDEAAQAAADPNISTPMAIAGAKDQANEAYAGRNGSYLRTQDLFRQIQQTRRAKSGIIGAFFSSRSDAEKEAVNDGSWFGLQTPRAGLEGDLIKVLQSIRSNTSKGPPAPRLGAQGEASQ